MLKPIDYNTYEMPTADTVFFKFETGKNRVRLLSSAHEIVQHELKEDGKFQTRSCKGEGCELCAKAIKTRVRFAYLVLDRLSNLVKVMEVGKQVFRQIYTYATDKEYGDPTKYDLTIDRQGEKMSTTYAVIASPKKGELTKDEVALVAEAIESGVTVEKAYEGK